jgi:hypothetical protein
MSKPIAVPARPGLSLTPTLASADDTEPSQPVSSCPARGEESWSQSRSRRRPSHPAELLLGRSFVFGRNLHVSGVSLGSRCGNPIEAEALGAAPTPITWADASSSPARPSGLQLGRMLGRRNPTRYSQVKRIAPPPLSGFGPGFSLVPVHEDLLRLGVCAGQRCGECADAGSADLPGIEVRGWPACRHAGATRARTASVQSCCDPPARPRRRGRRVPRLPRKLGAGYLVMITGTERVPVTIWVAVRTCLVTAGLLPGFPCDGPVVIVAISWSLRG